MKKILATLALALLITTANAEEINKARVNRINACLQAYEDVKPTTYQHKDQNLITRCATYATLVYAYESGYGKSRKCTEQKNCYGIKQGGKFVTYKTYEDGDYAFAWYYMKWHLNKNAWRFIRGYHMDGRWQYGWSQTDVYTYIDFISKNYWEVYNNIDQYDFDNIYNQ